MATIIITLQTTTNCHYKIATVLRKLADDIQLSDNCIDDGMLEPSEKLTPLLDEYLQPIGDIRVVDP